MSGEGEAPHVPVLAREAMRALDARPGEIHVDGTFGAGGYTRRMLAAGANVIAFDRDPNAIAAGGGLAREAAGRLTLLQRPFGEMAQALRDQGVTPRAVSGIVLDVGVSSMQIDDGARGFSFRHDGPLDMRMSGRGRSAADICNEASVEEIADILYFYGEERAARRIARAIAHDRAGAPWASTKALAEMIARVCPGKPHEIHPATRTFQALRIAVNDELGELVRALEAGEALLAPGGRLVVVTFHSLEDRIVKQFFASRTGRGEAASRRLPGEPARAAPTFSAPGKQPILPTQEEMRENPRARSAKLRFGLRMAAAARGRDAALAALAALPADQPRGG